MNKERLLKLAEHLEIGILGHKNFNFNVLNSQSTEEHMCETSGCAIGELPIIFPEEWKWKKYPARINTYSPRLIKDDRGGTWKEVDQFFDLTSDESRVLFIPYYYYGKESIIIREIELSQLDENATKEEVAAHIREFIRLKEL